MEHNQIRMIYFPKKEELNDWQIDGVDVFAYIDFQSTESLNKSENAGQIPFVLKTFVNTPGVYSSGVYTLTDSSINLPVNKYKWFTLVDKNKNRFRIASNTANTITLSTDYTFVAQPVSGEIKIQLPDFNLDDIFRIYVWNVTDGVYEEPANIADKLAFLGQVSSISRTYSDQGNRCTLKINDMTEVLLKDVKPFAYKIGGTLPKFYQKINNIIEQANASNGNSVNLEWDPTNPILKKDGITEFPDVDYYSDTKSSLEVISELVGEKYTADGEYFFYLTPKPDTSNTFLFHLRAKKFEYESVLTEGVDFKLISESIDKAEAISRLIVKCGLDPDGKRITTFVQGNLKYGTRGRPVAWGIAGDIMTKEIAEDDLVTPVFDTSLPTGGLYPTSYPYTTATIVTAEEAAQFPTKLTEGTFTANNDKEYREWIRNLSKAKAKILGRQYIAKNNKVLEQVIIEYYNVPTAKIPGSVDKLKIPSIGWTGGEFGQYDYRVVLRQNAKKIQLNSTGLTVQVTYKQDWEMSE
ncbi:MAG: hypothetical protein PHC31_10980 [Clostridia bacterium]|nr:hypothetical protein [Clostridia bacterium]